MSYNTESLIKESELVELFCKYGSVEVKRQAYKNINLAKIKMKKMWKNFCLPKKELVISNNIRW